MHETLEQRQLLAGDMVASWQNAANPMDVNNDEVVTPLDSLLIANQLIQNGAHSLDPSADADLPMMYVDVDDDGALTEQDFDAVVQYLNGQTQSADATGHVMGEGEGSSSGNNSPPEAYGDDSASVLHDQTLASYVYGFDPDPEDTITYSLVSGPSNGSLPWIHFSDGSFEYTPNLNFVGSDSFEFQVSDGIATDTATITIEVYNTEPEAFGDDDLGDEYYSESVLQHQTLPSYVYGSDPDPEDTITYSLFSGPANGTVSVIDSDDGSYEYTPNLGFEGVDSFEFEVSDGIATDTATITIDVYVPQVTFDLRVAEDDSHLAFQLDHYVGTDTSFDTFWVLPVPFELEVTLPDGLSPSEVQVSLWDGSVLDLTSNEQTLEFTALPPATGSILDAWAALAWTCDPTLQIASDDHPVTIEDTLKKHTEMVREYVNLCAELGIPTVVNESILEGMQDPFAQVKDYINNDVDFSLLTPAQQTELTNFRDVELNALRLDMSQKLTDLTLEHLIHQATAKTDAAGKMKELLDDLDSIDISLAGDKTLEITPVVGFDFNDTLKDALLNVDLPTVRDVLEKPHKLFTEVGLSGELYFDTESSVRVTGSVKNLNQDKTQSTYESSVEWFNVPLGLGTFTGNIRQGYTPATDTKDAAFTFGFDH